MNLEFKKMTLNDLNTIKSNLTTDFDNFWNYNILKSELENNLSYFIICKFQNEIVGFGGIKKILDDADIMNIVVKKDYRNKKIGTKLLNELINLAKSLNIKYINLEVNENNKYAIQLYINLGFIKNGKRNNYYNNNEAAILMQKDTTL